MSKNLYNFNYKDIKQWVSERNKASWIANKYGCSTSSIYAFCKKNGIVWLDKFDIGYKFNMLTVESKLGSFGEKGMQSIYWICRCDCGNIKKLKTKDITAGQYKSCGCWIHSDEYKKSNHLWNGHEDIHGKWWSGIKRGALARGHEFNITIEWAWELFLLQNKKCALSGVSLKFAKTSKGFQTGKTTASMDRIDSSIGYIENNIQWVHKDINLMKQQLTNEEFIDKCKLIVEYNT